MNKIVLFLFAATIVALAIAKESGREKLKRIHQECQDDPKTKIDEEKVKALREGEHVHDPNAAVHAMCMSKKAGFQDDKGKVVRDNIKEALGHSLSDEAQLEEAVNRCAVDKDTPEETGRHVWGCMMKVYRQHHGDHH